MYKLLLRTCALLVLFTAALFGQQGTIRGQVKDDSGALVPFAKVDLTGPAGLAESTVSDGVGSYSFSSLAPGSYSVQASAPNLAQAQVSAIKVRPGLQNLDLRLSVANLIERVTVSDDTPGASVSTASAENANALVLQGHDLDALSDDPDDLQADLQALAVPRRARRRRYLY